MTRVLMGDFSALHRLGLEDILRVDGIELMDTAGTDVLGRLLEALPDVIVLDLDKRNTGSLVETGTFAADMQVSLVNDGPVTFWLQVRPAANAEM